MGAGLLLRAASPARAGARAELLQAAIEHARARGAHTVEAYPVDPDSPSYGFLGRVPMFLAAGFEEVGRVGTRRHVMQLSLGGTP